MSEVKAPAYFITIGASAGGLNAVTELVAQLPHNLPVAIFLVLHLSKVGMGEFLIHRIQKYTSYKCKLAEDGEKIEEGYIYLARPDKHLLINNAQIIIGLGPAENMWRPSIDVLFRSAAAHHGNKVIGIILTGYLNDGTAGMMAIKKSGGTCIVQDPNEAEYPDMPLSVIENIAVDHCVKLKDIGTLLQELVQLTKIAAVDIPEQVILEARIAENIATGIDVVSEVAERSVFACPDRGGGLWKVKGEEMHRYRCNIGHAYSISELDIKQGESLEATLWVALRMMEERKTLLNKIIQEHTVKGLTRLALNDKQRVSDLETHIDTLKELLFSANKKAV